MLMTCRNEYTLFRDMQLSKYGRDDETALQQVVAIIAKNYGQGDEFVSTMMRLYSNRCSPYIQTFGRKLPGATAFMSDCQLAVPGQQAAVLHSRQGGDSHILRFDVEGNPILGFKAGHLVDVPYVFQNASRSRALCGAVVKPAAEQELLRIVKRFLSGQPLPWPAVDASATKPRRNVLIVKNAREDAPGVGQLSAVEADPFPEYFHIYESAH